MSASNTQHTLFLALQSTGILQLTFDSELDVDTSLAIVSQVEAGSMPGWISRKGDKLYSICRTNSATPSSGEIFTFQISPSGLTKLSQSSANGEGGVHLEVDSTGDLLAAATITGNTLSFYHLDDGGSLHLLQCVKYNAVEAPGVIAAPHQVAFDPTGQYIVAPLRTLDRIDVYLAEGHRSKVCSIELPKSTGPRHVAFRQGSPNTLYLYAACEKDNSLRVFSLSYEQPHQPLVHALQVVPVLGEDHGLTAPSHKDMAGEIAVSTDARFLYVSNRSIDPAKHDTLAVFALGNDGRACFLKRQSVGGLHPRMFALSPDSGNKYIAVCNQLDQTITIFDRDAETGFLGKLRGKLRVSPRALVGEADFVLDSEVIRRNQKEGPMCIQWR